MNRMKKLIKSSMLKGTVFLCIILIITGLVKPSHASAQVSILSHIGYWDALGILHIDGEVKNTGDVPVNLVKLTATFYDSNHVFIAQRSGGTFLKVILAGRKSPFSIWLEEGASSVRNYTLDVTFNAYPQGRPLGLEIPSSSWHVNTFLYIDGQVKNIRTTTATDVMVAATFYDSYGWVTGVSSSSSVPSNINPNQVASFNLTFMQLDLFSYITRYSLTAESNEYEIIPEFPINMIAPLLITLTLFVVLMKKRKDIHKH